MPIVYVSPLSQNQYTLSYVQSNIGTIFVSSESVSQGRHILSWKMPICFITGLKEELVCLQ